MMNEELVATVSSKFASGEYVVALLENAALVGPEWLRKDRILVLVRSQEDYALFVLLSMSSSPKYFSDFAIERVLPIDSSFKCEIDDTSFDTECLLHVTSKKLKLLFELKPGKSTAEFIDELFSSIDSAEKFPESRQFSWLHKYSGSEKTTTDLPSSNMDSPEFVVSRRNIAQGITPVTAIRESVINYQMKMKKDDYAYTQSFRIFVGSWNVNGQFPKVSLHDWLCSDSIPPDIYAIGFQELDLSKEVFLFNSTTREKEWFEAVVLALDSRARYVKVELVRLVGMMLIVFVQHQYYNHVRSVASDTVGTGIMGKMGNKGGVSIRFDLHNTSFCFVNSHLAAHVEDYERRNQDYHDICNRTQFSKLFSSSTIEDHDQIFWLGDLNYRITDMDHVIVKNHLKNYNIDAVLQADQLKIQHAANNVLSGFTEGIITFQPTYKYDLGTDNWDSSGKVRAPAWCDRIFWKSENVEQLSYRSHPTLNISDHKPVSAVFNSIVKVFDPQKYRKVHKKVIEKINKLENEFLPHVTVEPNEIYFNDVKYLEPQTQELCIANTGQVPVQFQFIKKIDESTYCKDWLTVEPYCKFLLPGEKCDVKLEVLVNKRSAYKFNSGKENLYEILVLHLDGGKDIFITVNGTYQKSSFGTSIEALIHLKTPIIEADVQKLTESNISKQTNPYPIPKEIWFLVDHIYKFGLKEPNLFKKPGCHSEILLIRDWLDKGSEYRIPGSINSVAEALLLLLESTAEPIIPHNHHQACINASNNYLLCKKLIYRLPKTEKMVFLYLCTFLQEVLKQSANNGTDPKTLANLFGVIFLRDSPQNQSIMHNDRKKAMFVYHFLINDNSQMLVKY